MARRGSFSGPENVYGTPVNVVKPADNNTGAQTSSPSAPTTIDAQLAELERLLQQLQQLQQQPPR